MVDKDNIEFDFTGHVKNIEDVDAVASEVEVALSDSDLEKSGLVKTSAFVRTSKSKNALRVKKHKEKKAKNGIKQVNVEIPGHHKDAIKKLSKDLCSGMDLRTSVLNDNTNVFQKLLIKLFF